MPEDSSAHGVIRYSQQLHLHTLETLCNDLVGGHAVEYGADGLLLFLESGARSVLSWYWRNQAAWTKSLSTQVIQGIIDSLDTEAPSLKPAASTSASGEKKLLTLVKIEAHRFAGISSYGTQHNAPENFIFEPGKAITMFEGPNGSGKTSLVNAVVWCLTGEIIRPQRQPERGDEEFEIEIECDENVAQRKIPPVTPMPRPTLYSPESDNFIPVDTWVELTFQDENGNVMPAIRRSLSRTNRGKIQESSPDLSILGIDPIAFRIGTTMPALLPFIQIGAQSELGQAVAELTGLSALIALSKHATKVSNKISGDLTKAAESKIKNIDQLYNRVLVDLEGKISEYSALKPKERDLPKISDDKDLEVKLNGLKEHFDSCKEKSFAGAVSILGGNFDAQDQNQIKELEGKIAPAIAKIEEIKYLSSASRLISLASLDDKSLEQAEALLQRVCDEAAQLADLANDPNKAKRNKLYARIAEWMKEFNVELEELLCCPVCSTDFDGQNDSVTDLPVKTHIEEHFKRDSTLLSLSIQSWVKATGGVLATELPTSLSQEAGRDLPGHPVELIRSALTDELFSTPAFSGVLSLLKTNMKNVFYDVFSGFERIELTGCYQLPDSIIPYANDLQSSISRIDRAIAFSRWRKSNKEICVGINKKVVGSLPTEASGDVLMISANSTLLERLYSLQQVTQSAKPINECLDKVVELKAQVALRRIEEKKLAQYESTTEALSPIVGLGNLAGQQIADLQTKLKQSTERWRNSVYKNYYSNSGHSLVDTKVAPEGQLSISVGSNGAAAPAQHVSNASALRASLLGFYLAFWEHVINSRGGLKLLLLDDPQELLDEDNKERLVDTLVDITSANAQLLVTTHDQRFATMAAKTPNSLSLIEHRSVHPVNADRHTIITPLAVADIDKKQRDFKADEDNVANARDYLAECRIFIEARLSDLFDDPAYATMNHRPTLMDYVNQARNLKKQKPTHELFGCTAFKNLCEDSAFEDNSKCLSRLNAAHHEGKRSIIPSDVSEIQNDLERLRRLSEDLHKEFRLYRRREHSLINSVPPNITNLIPANSPIFSVPIFTDLSAFTGQAPSGDSQDVEQEKFSNEWFKNKSLFYVKNDYFGFSAPSGSTAIVEIDGNPPKDQSLVIAIYKDKVLARRLLRDKVNPTMITLTTISTNPKVRLPSVMISVSEVELFRVVGFLFGGVGPHEIDKRTMQYKLIMQKVL